MRVCASRGLDREALGLGLFQSVSGLSVVTPRYRGWQPILVSLRCFGGRPPEDVSLCEVLRYIRGGCGRCILVVCCLVVTGIPFWPSSGSGGPLLFDVVVALSGRVRGA